MQKLKAALLLAAVVGLASGCGSGSVDPVARSSPNSVAVTDAGTREFVSVGSTGVSLFVPANAVNEATLFTISPFDRPPTGFPFTAGQQFLSGLNFQGFISLGRPAELQIPVFTTTPLTTTTVTVFQQTAGGLVQVPVTSVANGIVTFQTTTPGSFVVVQG